ncbi:hypothetical protein [Methanococcoides sp. AM1]|uniref:hypothetical protein n=1 Tax=Methanococcoides sp. AM1 TaxID=1201011 RepID=UPI001AF02502|nr:hypothetical protein [Methanococcoides sp. AM1]
MNYKHTQTGYFIIFASLVVVLLFGFILSTTDFEPIVFAIMLFIVLILISFTTLKVMIDENYLRIKYGYGIFWKRFPLNEIVSARTVKNHWYYGWGIRLWLWPKMVIFNVSGFDAVEIKMKNGKIYRIGTDEPKQLELAILQAIELKIAEF